MSSINFHDRTIAVIAPEPTAATRTPAVAISRGLEGRVFGIADCSGQRVDRATAHFGDQDQAGGDDQEAPAPLVDPKKSPGDRDQGSSVTMGEEARIASDCQLQAPPASRELAASVAEVGMCRQVGRFIENQLALVEPGNRQDLRRRPVEQRWVIAKLFAASCLVHDLFRPKYHARKLIAWERTAYRTYSFPRFLQAGARD